METTDAAREGTLAQHDSVASAMSDAFEAAREVNDVLLPTSIFPQHKRQSIVSERDSTLESEARDQFDELQEPSLDENMAAGHLGRRFAHMDSARTADEVTPSSAVHMQKVLRQSRLLIPAELPQAPEELLQQFGEPAPRASYMPERRAPPQHPEPHVQAHGETRGGERRAQQRRRRRRRRRRGARRRTGGRGSEGGGVGGAAEGGGDKLGGEGQGAAPASALPPSPRPPPPPRQLTRRASSMMGLGLASVARLTGSRRDASIAMDVATADVADREYMTCGAMCNIYTARWHGKQVVLKIPRDDAPRTSANDLELEMVLLKELGHPNICAMMFGGKTPTGTPFMAMEPLMGGSLTKVVDNMSRFAPWTQGLHYARDIACAFSFLHEEAIAGHIVIHRDLKPDNVCFTSDMKLKIVDFGLAKVVRRKYANLSEAYTMTSQTGSLRFMAPEVGLDKPYNEKVDVYSWALVCWYTLARILPYKTIAYRHFRTDVFDTGVRPDLAPSWPAELHNLLHDAWHPNFNQRPSFTVIVESLDAILASEGGGEQKPCCAVS
ncbi:kinase-like domain-containing protein [Tribonema minus]|uniref:Kinase-like domain-containing protein n=1 Tax=Tribonema minus TaxID=303371 RepID=A0A836CC53_9STRA|nr:kinase-like domain-containing protein [Tribonema minus]